MQYYLGIDQALGKTGVAVLDQDGGLAHLSVISTGKLREVERLAHIRDRLKSTVDLYVVKQACLEGYSYESTGRTFDLGEVGGLVRLLLFDSSVPFEVVAPAQLKKFAGCSPQADKEKVRNGVLKKWRILIEQNDACDAYVLAQVARVYDTGQSSYRDELEVIRKMKAPVESGTSMSSGRAGHNI